MAGQYFQANALAIIPLIIQLSPITLPGDDFGGLSGHDSILQGIVATFDMATGVLFTFAAVNFLFDPILPDHFTLRRWRFLHSTPNNRAGNIELTARLSPWDLTYSTRKGTLQCRSRSTQTGANEHALTSRWVPIEFASNYNLFVIPFLKQKQMPTEIHQTKTVGLSHDVVCKAAALSVIRLLYVFFWSTLIFFLRILLLFLHTPNWKASIAIAIIEFFRLVTAIAQELSVFTYSCAYKGVRTWAWDASKAGYEVFPRPPPEIWPDFADWPPPPASRWIEDQREDFEKELWQALSWYDPVRGFFFTACRFWTFCSGTSIFHDFGGPKPEEYTNDSAFELLLSVFDPKNRESQEGLVSQVHFKNVPASTFSCLNLHLVGRGALQYLGLLYLISSSLNIFLPFLFLTMHPSSVARVYYVVEQAVVTRILRYYDIPDFSINTKLKSVFKPEPNV